MTKNTDIFYLNQEEVLAITGARHGNPHHILGMHVCLSDVYVNAYLPDASEVYVIDAEDKTEYPMHVEYAEGFFTVKIENRKAFPYLLKIVRKVWDAEGNETDEITIRKDAYSFGYSADLNKVMQVVNGEDDVEAGFRVKELFGARAVTIDGTEGVAFCIRMPGCIRVSVVGDFNNWDGRVNPMRKIDYTDLFELFLPYDIKNTRYKFEVLYENGATDIFSDAYATAFEPVPGNASFFTELSYAWTDDAYRKERKKKKPAMCPINIYEVHMQSFKAGKNGEMLSYREFGKEIAAYVKSMKYNYIELMPLMEYSSDDTWGYDTTGMYAPTSRFGTPTDFMAMIDYLHAQKIGVIMDMVPVMDIDCMIYWIETYHLDGIRLDNKERIESFRKVAGNAYPDIIYDYTWNTTGVNKLIDYMRTSPDRRESFVDYVSSVRGFISEENQIMAMSHDEVAYNTGSYIEKMPGGYEDKYADLRILYGLSMFLPGKKLMFMGQELGMLGGFDGNHYIDWSVLEFDANKYIQKYVKELNALYLAEPALYESEKLPFVFSEHQEPHTVCFTRAGASGSRLFVVCNFGTTDIKNYSLATGETGTYKEIFSSDAMKYGGEGKNNKQQKAAKDGLVEIFLPALSIAVFKKVK